MKIGVVFRQKLGLKIVAKLKKKPFYGDFSTFFEISKEKIKAEGFSHILDKNDRIQAKNLISDAFAENQC